MAEHGLEPERDDVMSRSRHANPASQNQELKQELKEDAVRNELGRICTSEAFRKSERQKRFLTFVVEQTLSGNAGVIKEPVLAIEVFDRTSDYDPKIDTIVRVEARRLRVKLAEYYSSAGADDPIRIEVPTGSYAPLFEVRTPRPILQAPAVDPSRKRATQRFWLWPAVAGLIGIVSTAVFWPHRGPIAHTPPRIAVLPFQDLNPQGVDQLYSAGVTEALITDLAKVRHLQVISRTSVMRFQNTRQPLREIAAQLQADYVVEGAFQRNADQCRITAQLIRTADDVHVWAEGYDLPFTDILRVQRRVANEIVNRVNVALDPSERRALENPPTSSTEAYEDLLKARKNSSQYLILGKQDYYDDADRLLQRALQLDPGYVDAILERALLYGRRYQTTGELQYRAKAEDNLLAALGREPCEPVANAVMASVRNEYGDADAALRYSRRAVDCNPNSAQAHNSLGLVYLSGGFFEAAAKEFQRSAAIDPVFVSPILNLSGTLIWLNRKTDALGVVKKATEIEPESALTNAVLGLIWLENGNLPQANSAWGRAARFVEPRQLSGVRDLFRGLEDSASGRVEHARQLLRRHRGERWMRSVLWRGLYERLVLACEEPSEIVSLLEQAPELRSYRFLISHSELLDRLGSDAGFVSLLQQRYAEWQKQLATSTISPPPKKLPPPEAVIRHRAG